MYLNASILIKMTNLFVTQQFIIMANRVAVHKQLCLLPIKLEILFCKVEAMSVAVLEAVLEELRLNT